MHSLAKYFLHILDYLYDLHACKAAVKHFKSAISRSLIRSHILYLNHTNFGIENDFCTFTAYASTVIWRRNRISTGCELKC